MRQEKLSELLDISIGRTPSRNEPSYWGKGHRWVSIRDLSSKIVTETKEQITNLAVKDARCKIVKKGTLLFSFKLTIGKMAFAGCDLFTNEAIAAFAIKDEKELNPEFLYYALQSATYGGSNQAVMGKTLNSKSLAEIEIPLPSLDDQIRIAHLLGKVEGLIAQRKQHLQQLDDLLKSVFLEMFGDPVRNEKSWVVKPLQSVTSKIGSGATPTGGNEAYKSEGISLIRSMNVHDGKFVYKDLAFIDEVQANKLKNVVVEEHDVLLNITGASVCRCAIVPKAILPARVNQHVAIIRPKTGELNPKYLAAMFISNSYKTFLLKIARINGATREALTKDQLEKLGICKPPIELQNQFATIVEKTDAIKSSYQQSLTDLESLYGALSQQAFKGELDLSRVALPAAPIEGESPVTAGVPAPIATPVIELPETDLLLPAMHVLNET
ncbi:MAG: restriction endonuclease subunit S [bacterium]